jgi:hypothetical protein
MTPSRGDRLSPLWAPKPASLPAALADWPTLLGQARSTQLMARLALWCERHVGWAQVPTEPARYLQSALTLTRRQALDVRFEVGKVAEALAGLPGPVVLLKGAAYQMAGLPAAEGRSFADIDVLVPQAQLAQAESALFVAGWLAQGQTAYDDRYYREWMHELPPLTHIRRGSAIDLHHTITPPTSAFNVDGALLLAQAQPLDDSRRLWVLQPVDMVLHSAVHLFAEGEFDRGLRDLMDMDLLVKHFAGQQPDFWAQLFDRADALRLTVPLHHALAHLHRLFGTAPPAALHARWRALRPAWPARTLMGWLLARALRPNHPSCWRVGDDAVRWLLYVRSHWLRMPPQLLVPHLVRKAWRARFPDKPADDVADDAPARPQG